MLQIAATELEKEEGRREAEKQNYLSEHCPPLHLPGSMSEVQVPRAPASWALFLAWPPKVLQALVSAALLPSVLLGSRWQGHLPVPILDALPVSLGCLSSSLLLPRGSL